MQEFNQIEALWAQHSVDVKLSAEDVLKQAKKDVNNIRFKSLLNIIGMLLSVFAVASVWLIFDFTSVITHIGVSIIILAVVVYTAILYSNHRVIARNDFTDNPSVFLNKLKIYQLQRHQLYNRLYWFYVVALSLGMALYFLEILHHLPTWQQVLVLVLSFGWILFCSTLLRKAVIKRDKERISLLIEKFERISGQLKDTE
jgi:membrane protein YdbS with pleckstrin-like domain